MIKLETRTGKMHRRWVFALVLILAAESVGCETRDGELIFNNLATEMKGASLEFTAALNRASAIAQVPSPSQKQIADPVMQLLAKSKWICTRQPIQEKDLQRVHATRGPYQLEMCIINNAEDDESAPLILVLGRIANTNHRAAFILSRKTADPENSKWVSSDIIRINI